MKTLMLPTITGTGLEVLDNCIHALEVGAGKREIRQQKPHCKKAESRTMTKMDTERTSNAFVKDI